MRKFFEGHSLTGVVVIICVFVLAMGLRFYDLSIQSPWTDEVASWWYLRHLDEVWSRESHSPLYYALLKFFTGPDGDITPLRTFSAVVSVIHLIECFFLGQLAFDSKKKFLLFWVLICLNPADIVYARMARHYSWLLEGVLVFYLLQRIRAPLWLQSINAAFMGFIHVFAVIPISLLALYRYWREKKKSELVYLLCSANIVLLYYFLRIVSLGGNKVSQNVSWNSIDTFTFWKSVITQFLGEAYPRYLYMPVNPWLAVIVVGLSGIFILYRRKESAFLYFGIFIASLVIIELLTLWLNLRANRYIIYLVGLWIIAFVDAFDEVKDWQIIAVVFLILGYFSFHNPIEFFPWEREKVVQWQALQKMNPGYQQLVCSNIYQSEYYGLNASEECESDVEKVDRKKPLIFFDMNGSDTRVAVRLMIEMEVSEFTPMNHGSIAKFLPKEDNGTIKK